MSEWSLYYLLCHLLYEPYLFVLFQLLFYSFRPRFLLKQRPLLKYNFQFFTRRESQNHCIFLVTNLYFVNYPSHYLSSKYLELLKMPFLFDCLRISLLEDQTYEEHFWLFFFLT